MSTIASLSSTAARPLSLGFADVVDISSVGPCPTGASIT
jgi:hypothetical protein